MGDISSADLLRLLAEDEVLRDYLGDRLDLPPAPLNPVSLTPAIDDFRYGPQVLMLWSGAGVMVHLCVGVPGQLAPGDGLMAQRRAAFLRELCLPVVHGEARVALLTPAASLAESWQTAREFPYLVEAEDLGLHLRAAAAA
ncbi:MAG: hypothetical protein CSA72_06940 [Rhodobacterales bacterium]|nr:MAG: hypothetical protein CSA72_06940 [Rhodobacterales bacterium]